MVVSSLVKILLISRIFWAKMLVLIDAMTTDPEHSVIEARSRLVCIIIVVFLPFLHLNC